MPTHTQIGINLTLAYNVLLNWEAMYTTTEICDCEPRAPATCIPLHKPYISYLLFALFVMDIPRQSKIREAIIDAWQDYFDVLKKELAVSLSTFTSLHLSYLLPTPGCSWEDFIYCGHLVKSVSLSIPCHHHALD